MARPAVTHPLAKALLLAGALVLAAGIPAFAQPTPAPSTGDLACLQDTTAGEGDTVASVPDAEGFYSLFDGTFKGWTQSCLTSNSEGSTEGAIFRLGTADGRPAIYTNKRGQRVGGEMMTNRKFGNYELRFQTWPSWGNDAGIFNRTPLNGRCLRTTLSYIGGASMGGIWGNSGFIDRDWHPFSFSGQEFTLAIPGSNNGPKSNWTTITRGIKATTEPGLPCPETGCTQADWLRLWDADGWNDFRIQFYGGLDENTGPIHMKHWFKKPVDSAWVPLIQDTIPKVLPANRIGLEVHGHNRFTGERGTWYRDIRWRPLDERGNPLTGPSGVHPIGGLRNGKTLSSLGASAFGLSGKSEADYSVQVMDVRGRLLETFSGKAGPIDHAFTTGVRGLLFLRVHSVRGTETHRVFRPF